MTTSLQKNVWKYKNSGKAAILFSRHLQHSKCTTQVIIWCHKKNRCEGSLSNKTFYSVNIFVCISTFLDYIKVKCFHFYNLFIQIKRFLHSFSPKVTLNTFFSVLIVPELLVLTNSFNAPYQLIQKFFFKTNKMHSIWSYWIKIEM